MRTDSGWPRILFWWPIPKLQRSVVYIKQPSLPVHSLTEFISQDESTPDFNMTYLFGSDQLYMRSSAVILYEISTMPGAAYSPMDMEFILPFANDSAVLSVCRLEVISAGSNLPCFDVESVNNTVVYASK